MNFFTEVEVTDDGMLEEMQHGEADDDVEGGNSAEEVKTFRDKLKEYESEKEAGAERDEVFLNPLGPFLAQHDERSTEDFCCSGDQPKEDYAKHRGKSRIYRMEFS